MFIKNDNGFVCLNCGTKVSQLEYSSRDHCSKCLCSLHVDIEPGDRKNNCKGLLIPVDAEISGKKGYVITYKCKKCGEFHKNKTAVDDNFETIIKIMNKTYDKNEYRQ